MVREELPPPVGRRAASYMWSLPPIAIVVATALVAALVSSSARTPVIAMGVATVLAVAAAVVAAERRSRQIAALRALVAEREAALARQEAETVRLHVEVLPEMMERLRKGEFPETVLASLTADASGEVHAAGLTPEFRAAHRAVLTSVLEAVVAEEDLRDSAQRAFVNIARRVQAIIHRQSQELREMEERHGQMPEVFGDLLRIDHGTALIGRLADSIAVLGGARPGRQRSRAVPLYSVLRGAMSRIIDYQRVELHSVAEVAVVGLAVEPLIHALAELLDNATRYSPPHTQVHVTAVEVQSGIAVEIEDGGVSMSEEARRRAERTLEQAQQGIDVNDLGETPRLGLAVVGRLAQAYGFQVALRSSAYGGVRAVLVLPQALITTASAASGLAHGIGTSAGPRAVAEKREQPATKRAAAPSGPQPAEVSSTPSQSAGGLPQRRRRSRVTEPATPVGTSADTREEPQVQPGLWLGAFQSALAGDASENGGGSSGPGSKGAQ
jgi:signal transduction histidine kinase